MSKKKEAALICRLTVDCCGMFFSITKKYNHEFFYSPAVSDVVPVDSIYAVSDVVPVDSIFFVTSPTSYR